MSERPGPKGDRAVAQTHIGGVSMGPWGLPCEVAGSQQKKGGKVLQRVLTGVTEPGRAGAETNMGTGPPLQPADARHLKYVAGHPGPHVSNVSGPDVSGS